MQESSAALFRIGASFAMAQPQGPLKGLKIIDMTSVLLGPYATQILGDMGADVIKVEGPGGDIIRGAGPHGDTGMGPIFLNANRNKRSLSLNLKKHDAKSVLTRLLEGADVFIHNVRLAGIERLGFGYEAVKAIKPDIIYVHACGYGAGGKYEGLQAYDDLLQAVSGGAWLQAKIDGTDEPRYFPSLMADKVTGLHAVYAVMGAHIHKLQTGEGQFVEVPMHEVFSSFLYSEHLFGHTFRPAEDQMGYSRVLNPNRRPYRTKDGFIAILPYDDNHIQTFFKLGGRSDVFEDPRFSSYEARAANVEALYGIIAEVATTKTTEEWIHLLHENQVPSMRVGHFEEILEDEHLQSVGFFEEMVHPSEGPIYNMKHPINFEKSPAGTDRLAPNLGEHNEELLSELGFSAAEIAAMKAEGSLG
jgi:crotonobetainyl-CoA:carnitine CoA-transferase CaiB-like acyl-CoA transferase